MELFKFVGDTRVMTLVKKELRQELLISKEGFCSLSITFVQSELQKENLRRFQLTETVSPCSTVLLLEHITVVRNNREDKAGVVCN